MPRQTAMPAGTPAPETAIQSALAEALKSAGRKCLVCSHPEISAIVREWISALAGKRIGFQVERLSPAIEKDFGVYISRESLAKHIRRCEPDLAAAATYR